MFTIIYHPKAFKEIDDLPDRLRGRTKYLISRLEKEGNKLRFPYSSPLRDGLFELRVVGNNITRTIYSYSKGNRIYILRAFVKKTEKTPQKEILLAFDRLGELV